MAERILVIEDDPDIQHLLDLTLRDEGYETVTATTAWEGLSIARSTRLDLAMVDLNLPDMNGSVVTKKLRNDHCHLPIVILTALDAIEHKVHLMDLGANDFIVKPFNSDELLARLHVQFRQKSEGTLRVGVLEVNFRTGLATWAGRKLELSGKEFELLGYLARHPGRVFRMEELYGSLWMEEEPSESLLRVHMFNLRRKLETAGVVGVIRTVRGLGYGLVLPS
ncbi:response regulator transcription factor [Deinococcus yavapaiensis]|uniref:DNA-binding response OmpR family regulator n=1 Tax=Deinococcus yavapaiensis KR-236 TaxID=694435 RepID=A0A318SCS8_9DEIO|nr:response regulator transcription factor [Deinococcus yavapaiensis]PYE54168.1 DNA-binding response OmpR family regulator [Deinococcus yavapaiensis KR-236]